MIIRNKGGYIRDGNATRGSVLRREREKVKNMGDARDFNLCSCGAAYGVLEAVVTSEQHKSTGLW